MYMRDLRKPLELLPDRLMELISKLEEITDKKFNEQFADSINNFIGIMREKDLVEKGYLTNKKMIREINKVKTAAKNMSNIIDNGIDSETESLLLRTVPEGYEKQHNHSYHAAIHAEKLIKVCNTSIDNLNNREKCSDYSFTKIRDLMAVELARELSAYDIDIKTYENGVFVKCLKTFFKFYNGTAKNHTFSMCIPENLFDTLKKAKDEHLNSERFFLLLLR